MPHRPPHGSPDIEAVLTWAETLTDFTIDVRQDGEIYGRLIFREGKCEGASRWIVEAPRDAHLQAEQLAAWTEHSRQRGPEDELGPRCELLGLKVCITRC